LKYSKNAVSEDFICRVDVDVFETSCVVIYTSFLFHILLLVCKCCFDSLVFQKLLTLIYCFLKCFFDFFHNNLCIDYIIAYLKSSFCVLINFSSTTSSRRVCSRHVRIVCRLRRLRRIPSRVFWRCRSVLPRGHPFIRQIKTFGFSERCNLVVWRESLQRVA